MANDFSSKQIRVSQIIASGGIAGSSAGLIVYSASNASNLSGGIPAALVSDFSSDVFVFVSGSRDGVERGEGVTLFGGDVVVSGTLYAEKQVIEVDENVTGSMTVQGTLFVSSSATVAGGLTVNKDEGASVDDGFVSKSSTTSKELIRTLPNFDQVLVLSGGSDKSTDESTGQDVSFYVSGSTGFRGGARKGISVFGGDVYVSGAFYSDDINITDDLTVGDDLTVNGDLLVAEYIKHDGDTDTTIRFQDNIIKMTAGSTEVFRASDTVFKINHANADFDFRVESKNKGHALLVSGSTDQVLILSGGGETSYDESGGGDVSLYVSGAVGDRGNPAVRGTTVFGGDTFISGTLIVSGGVSDKGSWGTISGSIFETSDGLSYITAGSNVVVTSGSNGQIEISATGDIDGSGGANRVAFWSDSDTLTSDAGFTFDGSTLVLNDSAVFNEMGGNSNSFRVESLNRQYAFAVEPAIDQVLILSGGSDKSNQESSGADVAFYVSGSVGKRGNPVERGASVFGGDIYVSGVLHASQGISGSITNLTDGTSYISAGANITVTSASNGQISIAGASTTPGGSDTQLQFNDDGSFGGISGVTTDGSVITFGDSAILVGQDITHTGDADTKITFGADSITLTAGNESLLTITESTQDIVTVGDGGDVDFQVKTNGDDNTLFVQGSSDRVGVGTNAPSTVLHVKESAPTVTIQRESNANNSTLQFMGQAGATAAVVHMGSTNDIVMTTFDGIDQEEILRLGSHYAADVRQVILLSGSGMGAGALQPKEKSDINFFVSGAISSRGTSERGTAVFGGDLIVSGALALNQGAAAGSQVFVTTTGRVGIGTDDPDYKLDVAGNIGINEYIYHNGDADTKIQFQSDAIKFFAGNKNLFQVDEDESTVTFNVDNNAINTIISTDTKLAFAAGTPLGAGKDQILIMSGGAATSFNEAAQNDVLVYISGSRTQIGGEGSGNTGRHTGDRTNTVFGGDVVFSGSIYGAGTIDPFGTTALHLAANVLQVDALTQIALCDNNGGAPGFGPANATDTFFSVSGSIGSINSPTVKGAAVFGGDAVISGSFRTGGQLHLTTHKLAYGDTTARFARFDSNGGDASAGGNNKMVTPYGGRLIKVIARGSSVGGSTVIGFHRNTDGNANLDGTTTEDITVNMSSANTSYTFNFTGTSNWAGGDIIGIKINPTSDPGTVIATAVWEFDNIQ